MFYSYAPHIPLEHPYAPKPAWKHQTPVQTAAMTLNITPGRFDVISMVVLHIQQKEMTEWPGKSFSKLPTTSN